MYLIYFSFLISFQFREKAKDLLPKDKLHNDAYLIRWLRARDMDQEKAYLMLSNVLDGINTVTLLATRSESGVISVSISLLA